MLNAWGTEGPDFYPEPLRPEIDDINALVYDGVNDAVYQAGFASSQAAYEEAFDRLFATLDALDERLATRRYLVGDAITLADWRLFTTLVRFDAVYVGHFKCNLRRIVAGRLRRGLRPAVRAPRPPRRAPRDPPLSRRRRDHAGGLAPVHHARALRRRLRRPLQVQPAPHRRLPAPERLPARPLPAPGR